MANDKPLSDRQRKILAYINQYVNEHFRPPTIREIGRACKISSTSVVNYNLTKLMEKGYLDRDPEVSRGLRLTDKFSGATESATHMVREALSRVIRVPLAGNIVAGEPIEVGNGDFSTYDEDDSIEVSETMLPRSSYPLFALRVSGDSMIDAMVNDGDIVILEARKDVRDGDMVAAWLEDETTTLKYIFNEGGRIRLQPANPSMDPIYVDADQVDVRGKVKLVLRQTV